MILKKNKLLILALLLIIIFSIFFSIFFSSKNLNKECFQKKYAICIWGEPRAIPVTIDSFQKHLAQPLDADLFAILNKTNDEFDNDINIYDTIDSNKIIYDKPENITQHFSIYDKLIDHGSNIRSGYMKETNLQILYNFNKINETFGELFEKNYQYIILTRTDFLHLFDFPNILELTNNKDDIFWSYDGHEHGGLNATLFCVPSKYIRNYLSCPYNAFQDNKNIDKFNKLSSERDFTIEAFLQLLMDENNWKVGKMDNNAFLTAASEKKLTSWTDILYDEDKKVFYKYPDQLEKSYTALEKYNKGYKWTYLKDKEKIVLIP
jgi:hypothetical protein